MIGSGNVYLNSPEAVFDHILGSEAMPILRGRGYYTPWKFIKKLNTLAERYKQQYAAEGQVVLLGEMENTFYWSNLPQLRSRINAYRFSDALFCGCVTKDYGRQHLRNIFLMLAITPGVIEHARAEQKGYWHNDNWIENPAVNWTVGNLPDQLLTEPLSKIRAFEFPHLSKHRPTAGTEAEEMNSIDKMKMRPRLPYYRLGAQDRSIK